MEKLKPDDNQSWGTWEELLLACAVKRHGFEDWDSVAMEVQTRTSLPPLLTTARNCELKFIDLKRRYTKLSHSHAKDTTNHQNDDGELSPDNDDTVDRLFWLDELRKLRVAELRQQVQRSDVSILTLQLRVKRLEEERERSLKEEQERGENSQPDLDVSAGCTSENNDKQVEELNSIKSDGSEPVGNVGGKTVRGDESDRDNQSVNESNSTGSRSENVVIGEVVREVKLELEVGGDDSREPVDRYNEPVGGESGNEYREVESVYPSEGKKVEDSSELRGSSADGQVVVMKDSSEVQSSATLTRKRNKRRRKELSGATSGEEQPENEEASVKSQSLAGFLEMIKGREYGSLFESLVESKDSEKYKKLVRQHLDWEKIQLKLGKGYYSSCVLALFRDLLLLFNNAVLYFPEDSVESTAAHQLRRVVSKEIKAHIQNPPPNSPQHQPHSFERSESDASKHNPSAPILVCRKRSSIASKASSGNAGQQSGDSKKPCSDSKPPIKSSSSETAEEAPTVDIKPKEKPTTGFRSFRRSTKNIVNDANSSKKPIAKNTGSKPGSVTKSTDTVENLTKAADEKKLESTTSTEKKRSAADFLKRIKRNSPAETLKITGGAISSGGGGRNSKTAGNSRKEQKKTNGNAKNNRGSKEKILSNNGDRKGRSDNLNPLKRNVGRPSKKRLEADAVSGKRARESSGKEEAAPKKPKKRARR